VSRRGPIIAAVISAVVALLAVVVLVLPKMHEVSKAKDELATAQDQETSLRAQLASLEEAKTSAEATKKEIAKVDSQIPPTADLPGLLRLLTEAADRSALDFFSVAPGTPALDSSNTFSIIPTTINVTGSYSSLEEFLFRLETLPRAAKVTNISITPQASSTGEIGAPTLSLQMTTEFYTSDTSAGPGSAPGPAQGA
jgi:Tfp pilus assembly protein PilO